MEVTIDCDGLDEQGNPQDRILKAKFTMVARDAATGQAAQVNPLILESSAERRLAALGAELKARKKLAASHSLTKEAPTPDERLLIHDQWLQSKQYEGAPLPTNRVWHKDTKIQSVHVTQPQDKNIHNKIFGGYLLRQAYELAYANASLFARGDPIFLVRNHFTALNDSLYKT